MMFCILTITNFYQSAVELNSPLLEHLRADGVLVLSGILSSQAEVVAASYLPELRRAQQWQQDDWICMTLRGETR